nr:hypothetical protein [Tanacetum cinerariifolium]
GLRGSRKLKPGALSRKLKPGALSLYVGYGHRAAVEAIGEFHLCLPRSRKPTGKIIKSLRSDRGGEYMSQEFLDHLKEHGIISHRTPPYTPHNNGVSKRRNRTLLDMDCEALVKCDTLMRPNKMEPRSIKCIFVGYPEETMGYSFYYPPENKVFVTWNAKFFENSLITQDASGILEDLEIIHKEDTHPSIDTSIHHDEDDQEIDKPLSDINPICKSSRTRRTPDRMCLHVDVEEHELGDLGEPANYKAALLDPESKKWLNAMKVGMQSIRDNKVWDLVDLPPNGKTVDDILIMGNNISMLKDVKSYLGRCFAMKDLGEAAYILEIKIYRDRSKRLIGLCQSAYIEKILKRYFMENSKRGTVLMQENLKLSKSQGASVPAKKKRMQNVLYALAVGSIMYALRCTRPDVAFTHNVTSDTKRELMVSCYTDAGYLMDADASNVEYIAAFDASKEAVWIQKFIYGLDVVPTIEEPINTYCDNNIAIATANDHGITKGARHFHAKFYCLRETIEMGDVRIEKVDTYDNLADPFTKALAFFKHSKLTKKIGIIPASSLM